MDTALSAIKGNALALVAPSKPARPSEADQYLTFMLDGEMFAIGILAVKEIIEYSTVTVVPMMPNWIRGVLNLRGAVVPVLDLSARFGRRSTSVTKRTCIVIVEVTSANENQVVGVVVDSVNQVLGIPDTEIEPPPMFGVKLRNEYIHGMGKVDGKFVILLDPNRILSAADLADLDGVGQESALAALPGENDPQIAPG